MRSNVEWRTWGRVDPLWGVVTLPNKGKTETNAWTNEDFYAHGEREWHDILPIWQSFGLNTESCLEIGAGAGRITRQLSRTFGHVTAIDVSEHVIHYAETHVTADNVNFFVTNGYDIPVADRSVTAVLSLHVFQHFDSVEDSVPYWERIYRVLKPGGTTFIQLPIHHWPMAPRLFAGAYNARRLAGSLVASVRRRQQQRGSDQLFLRVVSYDADWLLSTLARIGYVRTELRCIARPDVPYWVVVASR